VRIAITSDIHANLAALEAVLADAGPVDGIWNTGDAVGYGPQPRECIARLREAGAVWVAGNHERAATGAIGTDDFNPAAAWAAQWTGAQLTGDDKALLDGLPETAQQGDFTLCHGTLRDPIWEYMDDGDAALAHLALQRTKFGIVGHTHVPALVREMSDTYQIDDLSDGEVVELTGEARLVLNPGSVGQPRDGDKRASYGVYDSDAATFTLHRVEYDIARTQKLMVDAGLPDWLGERLAIGR
jgi:diadenosine tetraphosphatase ApaH/serine/threonine PP2A family protein phosphatase